MSAAVSIYLFKPPYAIGSAPILSSHALAYRWRSLPRVRRHRTSSPQVSSRNECYQFAGLPMDQIMYASLFPHPLLVGRNLMKTRLLVVGILAPKHLNSVFRKAVYIVWQVKNKRYRSSRTILLFLQHKSQYQRLKSYY